MKIKSFDRTSAKAFASAVEAAVEKVCKEFGVAPVRGSVSWMRDGTSLTMKVGAAVTKGGVVQSPEVAEFKRSCTLFGLKPDDLGREFENNGRTFTICGLSPRRAAFPITAKAENGKLFKFAVSAIPFADKKAPLAQARRTRREPVD